MLKPEAEGAADAPGSSGCAVQKTRRVGCAFRLRLGRHSMLQSRHGHFA